VRTIEHAGFRLQGAFTGFGDTDRGVVADRDAVEAPVLPVVNAPGHLAAQGEH
jgi:hypothetical protein